MSRKRQQQSSSETASVSSSPHVASRPPGDDGKSRQELLGELAEYRRVQQSILRRNQELAALNAIAETVSGTLDLDSILSSALDKTLEILGVRYGAVYLLDPDGKYLRLNTIRAISESVARKVAVIEPDAPAFQRLVDAGKPTLYASLGEQRDFVRDYHLDGLVEAQLKSSMLVPLMARGKLFGVMAAITQGDRVFTSDELDLFTTISRVVSMAVENSLLYQDLREREQNRAEALREALRAREEERRKIARELHDHTSQVLTGVSAKIEAAMASLPPASDPIRDLLAGTRQALTGMIVDLRAIIHELRPPMLDDLGLVAAIQWHADEYLTKAGITTRFETEGKQQKLAAERETGLFRIVQEATTNIVKHSQATQASIRLEFGRNSVSLTVEDNGTGFDATKVTGSAQRHCGMGLLNMRERAEMLDGDLKVRSRSGRGCTVSVVIPIN